METRKMNKFDIDIEIKDIIWELVRKWRIIIVLAIICGVGLTAYQYRIDMNKTDVVTVKKTQEELETSMSIQDLDEVTAAVALRRQADERSAYMEESVLMRINPYEENVVFQQYYVNAVSELVSVDASDAYIAYVEQGLLAKAIADKGAYELEQMYLAELISVEKQSAGAYINAKSAADRMALDIEGNAEERVFTVKVVGTSKEAAEALAKDVKDALQEYSSVIDFNIGTHQLRIMVENSTVIAEQSLAELQNWNATSIKTISNNLDSMKNEMTSDQISLYTYRTTVLAEEESVNATTTTIAEKAVSISIKHMLIGVAVGIILGCAVIAVMYLFAATLRNGEEVKNLYEVKILGYVDDSAFQKKKLFAIVDELIIKLQHIRKKKLTFEQEIRMVCTNILLSCEKSQATEVFLVTSVAGDIPKEVIDAIGIKCAQRGITVTVGTDVAYDAETLEKMVKVGRVVFLEKEGASLYNEIYQEITLCKAHGMDIIGMIVVGV